MNETGIKNDGSTVSAVATNPKKSTQSLKVSGLFFIIYSKIE